MEELMSHLQVLDDADIETSLEDQIKAFMGIDEHKARIVLQKSATLKIEILGLSELKRSLPLNLLHNLIDLISHIHLTALASQLSKTPPLRQQPALR